MWLFNGQRVAILFWRGQQLPPVQPAGRYPQTAPRAAACCWLAGLAQPGSLRVRSAQQAAGPLFEARVRAHCGACCAGVQGSLAQGRTRGKPGGASAGTCCKNKEQKVSRRRLLTPSKPFKRPAQIYNGVPKPLLRWRPLPAAIRVSERPWDGGGVLHFDICICGLPWWLCLRFAQICPLKPALRGGSGRPVARCLPYCRKFSRACQVALRFAQVPGRTSKQQRLGLRWGAAVPRLVWQERPRDLSGGRLPTLAARSTFTSRVAR